MPDLLDPGEPAPEFQLADIHNCPVSLADYRGRPIVLAFLRGFL